MLEQKELRQAPRVGDRALTVADCVGYFLSFLFLAALIFVRW
jgi:hypothetical protein